MRLIVLPLSRNRALLYCQTLHLPKVRSKPRLDEKLVAKATQTWHSFEKSDTKWKQKIVQFANFALERIPYTEWALKTVPPLNTFQRKLEGKDAHVKPTEIVQSGLSASDLEPIEVVYPSTAMSLDQAKAQLATLASRGLKTHRTHMLYCLVGIPLTLPVALIPVIPNIPGFYLTYRLWSNWMAWRGAKHLDLLLKDAHLQGTTLRSLDYLYRDGSPDLLTDDQIDVIERIFTIPELTTELHRAVRQIKSDQSKKSDESSTNSS